MTIHRWAASATAAALLLSTAAIAQGPGGWGGRGGMWGMRGGMANTANPMGLLMRSDVQRELHLSIRQKNDIGTLLQTSRQQMMQRMQNARQQMRSMPRDQRRQQMQDMMAQRREQMAAFQGELNQQIKQILKPEQVERLGQLDLQYRGPLALADPAVAEQLKISPEHRTAIQQISTDNQTKTREVFMQAMQEARDSGAFQRGQAPDFQSRLSPVRQKTDALRAEAEQKVLAVLSEEEAARWKAAQGASFTFRADVQTGVVR